jgi:energy-coupling factor transport system permease protein
MMSWIFVTTTQPSDLSTSLAGAGLPYRYAFLPALSMRFVPVFRVELSTVVDAQVTRGLRLEKNLRGLVRSVRYTMMPMLVSAMAKVNSLASSMAGRGFGSSEERTYLKPSKFTALDAATVALAIVGSVVIFLTSREYGTDLFALL